MRFHKMEIAKAQLETAVRILVNGLDRSSVITLAGAAGAILDTLVAQANKEPFVDYARRIHQAIEGSTPKRKTYFHHIEQKLGITAHKHFSQKDSDTVELDLEKMAVDSVIRAMGDYVSLAGDKESWVQAFYQYTWRTLDGKSLLAQYSAIPDRFKQKK